MSLAWRVMVPVSGRGSSSCSVTIAEDAPLDGAAGHLRSCSDLHGSGCARIQRSCSCGTTGRRICRSRGVSTPHYSLRIPSLPFIPRALPLSRLSILLSSPYGLPYARIYLLVLFSSFLSKRKFLKAQRSMEIG